MPQLQPTGSRDWARLARYPFLGTTAGAIAGSGITLQDILAQPGHESVRRRAIERIGGALGKPLVDASASEPRACLVELLATALARVAVTALGHPWLLGRYAAFEGRLAHAALLREPDPDVLSEACASLGIPAERVGGRWTLHFGAYLRHAPIDEPGWHLAYRCVESGRIRLDGPDMARLTAHAVHQHVLAALRRQAGRRLPDESLGLLRRLVAPLQPELEEAAPRALQALRPDRRDLFPPCMQQILANLAAGANVSHDGRFAIATFLNAIGWTVSEIHDLFAAAPNFDSARSLYQVEHVTGHRGVPAYAPPGCATLQGNGTCPLEQRDATCFQVHHPLTHYRAQLRHAGEASA